PPLPSPSPPIHLTPPPTLHLYLPLPPPHPKSTLFPYTTLFRSRSALLQNSAENRVIPVWPPRRLREIRGFLGIRRGHSLHPSFGDRKSTRLNSSHVSISYAVFCLKKKNNIIIIFLCYE